MQTIKLAGQATLVKSRLFKQNVKEALIKKQVLIPLYDVNGNHIADLTGTSAKIDKEGVGNVVWYLSAEVPINIEKRSEMMVIVGSMISVKCIKWLTTIVIEIPKITPTMPPRPESTIASIRNWIRIS